VAPARGIATDPLIAEARRRARRRRLVVAALAVAAACAGAAYLRSVDTRTGTTNARANDGLPANGALTVLWNSHEGVSVSALEGKGRIRTIYRCGISSSCAAPASLAWAPDGRRVALSFVAFGGQFPNVGIHIVQVATSMDRRIPSTIASTPGGSAWATRARRRIGCFMPAELAWSPDGSTLAYRCTFSSARGVQLLRLSGGAHRTIVGGGRAFWPSWSPDGRRIAYSTTLLPHASSRIYTVSLDGTDRRLVARDGAAPVWSPDARTIAYQAACGVRMVTPGGRDVTPVPASAVCGIGPTGRPVWSPDGTQIAISSGDGTYTMAPDGSGLQQVSRHTGRTAQGVFPQGVPEPGRIAWQPKP
jgi:WD40 repeat protein